ncbi:MAG: S8 family serine peptidase [Armatimonadota bacterium]|nr:S8 family serine peptidase [Armatimonadota bacterium]MDR7427030.1 S8 family serine peptidase [Armatimonadota bacterium]MDR7465322.1 S8 family serine peptidase [Armatimonadota bacterium]MDR7468758.1 S8 family serine peptidase [Armatimonadota bacterium]MDR7473721.1 S8 family serine peptidase [Armatimonadota bacterium]
MHVPDRLMVKFRPGIGASASARVHAQAKAVVVGTIDRLDVQVVRLGPGASAAEAMAAYRASGLVEYVEQDAYVYAAATPNDPMYTAQWHFPLINLPLAWETTTGGVTIVAVLDTGIRFDHPDLAGVTVPGFDFFADPDDADPTDPGCPTVDPTDFSHGTHVSGTIGALTNNAVGVAGVTWGGAAATMVMPIRILGEDPSLSACGVGSYADLAAAITYAADHGAKVISMSLAGAVDSTTVDNAISYARARGVTLVAAAGNGSCGPVSYPARNAQVIAVAATGNGSPPARASYSNCGPELDIAAPGGDGGWFVLSTSWRPYDGFANAYVGFQGTSMATPHVAGVIALMISRGWVGPAAIQARLEGTATDLGASGKDAEFGSGLVDASAAIGGAAASTRMRAFSGVIDGTTIRRQSDGVEVAGSGAFLITSAQAGTKTVFVWQDFNADGTVDADDFFGQTPGVVISPGATTSGVSVTVQRYSGPTLTVN